MKRIWVRAGHLLFWLSWPLIWLSVHWTRRTRVVIHKGSEVLLVKGWLSSNRWQLPGGGLHNKEDSRSGAVREVMEETGIRLDPAKLVLLEQGWTRENGISFRLIAFNAKFNRSQTLRHNRLELTDARWFSIGEALRKKPLTATTRHLLETWLGKR